MEEPHFPPACKHSRYLLLKNNKHWLKNNKLIYFRMGSVYSARQQLNTYFSIAKRLSRSLFYCNFSSSKLDQWPLSSLGRSLPWGFWGSPARWLGPWVEEPHFPPACKHSRYLLLKNNKHWLKNNKLIYFRMGKMLTLCQEKNNSFTMWDDNE